MVGKIVFHRVSHGLSEWHLYSPPHVRVRLRRLYESANKQRGDVIKLPHTPAICEDLLWILERYPHTMDPTHQAVLAAMAEVAVEQRRLTEEALTENHDQPVGIAIPLRPHQLQAVAMTLANRGLLLGDDLGLGKTASAIGVLCDPIARPAMVVCPVHMQRQWAAEIARFAPKLETHICLSGKEYVLPLHDVFIVPYSKLAKWRDRYFPRGVVFDEVQELRRHDSAKWAAAESFARVATVRMGLSATPVYNYGDETWPVFQCCQPDRLGALPEFLREWCEPRGSHHVVSDPVALGTYLRAEGLFLRRTREEIGRTLPPLVRVVHELEYDPSILRKLAGRANGLARQVLQGAFTEKGQAARELDQILRQATGIAKAPFAAAFIASLVEQGEPVLVGAWHREVWGILARSLRERKIPFVSYTGEESPVQKEAAKKAFIDGSAKVMLMSLRSGAGVDGLQFACRTIVYAELDWSPKVMTQQTGRLHREGQENHVTEIFLVADHGSDPIITRILGLKDSQADGIADLRSDPLAQGEETSRVAELAREWLASPK